MSNKTNCLVKIFKGIFIGFGTLVPGISGGTAAIISGVFEDILEATANFFLHIKHSIKTLFPIAVGVLIGVLSFTPILSLFTSNFPIVSKYVFCICSLISTYYFFKSSVTFKYTSKKAISLCFGILSVIVIRYTLNIFNVDFDNTDFVSILLLGLPLALSLILPALSFSYMLLFLGLYDNVLESIAYLDFNFLLALFSGLLIGIILFSKLLLKLVNKCPQETYSYVFGFVIYSTIDVLFK